VQGEDGKRFRTRSGGTVPLRSLLTEAQSRCLESLQTRSSDLDDKELLVKMRSMFLSACLCRLVSRYLIQSLCDSMWRRHLTSWVETYLHRVPSSFVFFTCFTQALLQLNMRTFKTIGWQRDVMFFIPRHCSLVLSAQLN